MLLQNREAMGILESTLYSNIVKDVAKDSFPQINTAVKLVNAGVNASRALHDPTNLDNVQKLCTDVVHLAGITCGFTYGPIALAGLDVGVKLYQGKYKEAASSAVISAAHMAIPVVSSMGGYPAAFASAMMLAYNGYEMISNLNSLKEKPSIPKSVTNTDSLHLQVSEPQNKSMIDATTGSKSMEWLEKVRSSPSFREMESDCQSHSSPMISIRNKTEEKKQR